MKLILDVLFILSLRQNLLSVAQMVQNGYSLFFKQSCCFTYDAKNNLVVELPMVDGPFPLNWNYVKESVNFSKSDESVLWHKRFGHYNFGSLSQLQKNEMVYGLPEIIKKIGCVLHVKWGSNIGFHSHM